MQNDTWLPVAGASGWPLVELTTRFEAPAANPAPEFHNPAHAMAPLEDPGFIRM
jgi:hypothetical protein